MVDNALYIWYTDPIAKKVEPIEMAVCRKCVTRLLAQNDWIHYIYLQDSLAVTTQQKEYQWKLENRW